MDLQLRLVSGWGLQKRRSAPPYGPLVAWEGQLWPFFRLYDVSRSVIIAGRDRAPIVSLRDAGCDVTLRGGRDGLISRHYVNRRFHGNGGHVVGRRHFWVMRAINQQGALCSARSAASAARLFYAFYGCCLALAVLLQLIIMWLAALSPIHYDLFVLFITTRQWHGHARCVKCVRTHCQENG